LPPISLVVFISLGAVAKVIFSHGLEPEKNPPGLAWLKKRGLLLIPNGHR